MSFEVAADRADRFHVKTLRAAMATGTGAGTHRRLAVPIDSARRSLVQFADAGRVSYAFADVRTMDVTPALHLHLPVARGALVVKVEPGTAAARAGLRAGPKASSRSGARKVWTGEDVARIVAEELRPRQLVDFTVVRDGRRLLVSVRLGSRRP